MYRITVLSLFLILTTLGFGQNVQWETKHESQGDNKYTLIMKGKMDKGMVLYGPGNTSEPTGVKLVFDNPSQVSIGEIWGKGKLGKDTGVSESYLESTS